ncbi:uncharacterized protein DS421_16g565480 [Arachis hypogaea]|nr:uncharacterized protein DS421_16g565480 [Arachis hypogaea]
MREREREREPESEKGKKYIYYIDMSIYYYSHSSNSTMNPHRKIADENPWNHARLTCSDPETRSEGESSDGGDKNGGERR